MKRICILLLVLSLGILTLCQPTFAVPLPPIIGPGQSLWVQLDPAPAPTGFDGMTLFWGLETWDTGANLDYYIYGPDGYTSVVPTTSSQAPAIVDLSIFEGKDVVFEFRNVSTEQKKISFKNPVAVNDYDPPVTNGEFGTQPLEFYYAFYDNATSDWETRDVNKYIAGSWSYGPPDDLGDQFFFHDLDGTVDGQDPTTINIRSDFQAVPEPATLLLLASGIAVLAGGRRKFKKK